MAAVVKLVIALRSILIMLGVSAFLAVVLNPAVDALARRGLRRGLAIGLVYLAGLIAALGLGYLFVHPLYTQVTRFADQLPDLVRKTQQGKGPVSDVLRRYHLEAEVRRRLPELQKSVGNAGSVALSLVERVAAGAAGLATILVVTFLILLEAPGLIASGLAVVSHDEAERIRRVARDIGRSVSGYVIGNVTTSLIAGVVCGVALLIMGVPFAYVFAVWVGVVDLLPLVGGLLAGVPTVGFAFLHSIKAGIVLAIVFLTYQQIENHALNPAIMSRTVRLNPLWVIISVLVGAELLGIVGALLAIPAAAALQVVVRDVWDERHGGMKERPTTGPEERPVPFRRRRRRAG